MLILHLHKWWRLLHQSLIKNNNKNTIVSNKSLFQTLILKTCGVDSPLIFWYKKHGRRLLYFEIGWQHFNYGEINETKTNKPWMTCKHCWITMIDYLLPPAMLFLVSNLSDTKGPLHCFFMGWVCELREICSSLLQNLKQMQWLDASALLSRDLLKTQTP